jgi:hypothetical protein
VYKHNHAPRSLPPRSTAGQLTLDQHIGVRIPGGQPITFCYVPSFPTLPETPKVHCNVSYPVGTSGRGHNRGHSPTHSIPPWVPTIPLSGTPVLCKIGSKPREAMSSDGVPPQRLRGQGGDRRQTICCALHLQAFRQRLTESAHNVGADRRDVFLKRLQKSIVCNAG